MNNLRLLMLYFIAIVGLFGVVNDNISNWEPSDQNLITGYVIKEFPVEPVVEKSCNLNRNNDYDFDGDFDSTDLSHLVEVLYFDMECRGDCDINNDGVINALDEVEYQKCVN